MKKKYRDITVDGIPYAWQTNGYGIKIWRDKKVVFDDYYYKDSETSDKVVVTPKIVETIIRKHCL